MDNNILFSFMISLFAGLSTLLGCFLIFVKPRNIEYFIGSSLSFSATIMFLISFLELIPNGYINLKNEFSFFISILIILFMIFIGYMTNVFISKSIRNNNDSSDLYRVGILSMIVLMIHNLPEGILTFLTTSIDESLGLKFALTIMMHNIPEGIAIAVPIFYSTKSSICAIKKSLISGLSEPFGALLAYLFLYRFMSNTLISLILLFVCGIMISVSVNDIFNEARKYSFKSILFGILLGFLSIILMEFVI